MEVGDAFHELAGERVLEALGQKRAHGGQIPQGAITTAFESLPGFGTMETKVGKQTAGVVEFVGSDDQEDGGVGLLKVAEMGFLAVFPRWLWRGFRIGAGVHHNDHTRAKEFEEAVAQQRGAADFLGAVLDGVVQKRGDGLVFVTTVFEDEGGDGEQVGDVGDVRAFAQLVAVQAVSLGQGDRKTFGEHG